MGHHVTIKPKRRLLENHQYHSLAAVMKQATSNHSRHKRRIYTISIAVTFLLLPLLERWLSSNLANPA